MLKVGRSERLPPPSDRAAAEPGCRRTSRSRTTHLDHLVKRLHEPRVAEEGIPQLCGYLDQVGLAEGWMLVFDQRPGQSREERRWREQVVREGKTLHLCGS